MRLLLVCSLVLSQVASIPDAAPTREEIDRMHAAMIAVYVRDRPAVERFYVEGAEITESERRHAGRAAVQAYWDNAAWQSLQAQEAFAVAADGIGAWVAGHTVIKRHDGATVDTFFVRLLTRTGEGEWKIAAEAASSAPGTNDKAALDTAIDRWLASTRRADSRVERQTFLFGSLAVATGQLSDGLGWSALWIQSRGAWRLAGHRFATKIS